MLLKSPARCRLEQAEWRKPCLISTQTQWGNGRKQDVNGWQRRPPLPRQKVQRHWQHRAGGISAHLLPSGFCAWPRPPLCDWASEKNPLTDRSGPRSYDRPQSRLAFVSLRHSSRWRWRWTRTARLVCTDVFSGGQCLLLVLLAEVFMLDILGVGVWELYIIITVGGFDGGGIYAGYPRGWSLRVVHNYYSACRLQGNTSGWVELSDEAQRRPGCCLQRFHAPPCLRAWSCHVGQLCWIVYCLFIAVLSSCFTIHYFDASCTHKT